MFQRVPQEELVKQIYVCHFGVAPQTVERCAVGQGNYVYAVKDEKSAYIMRLSPKRDAYEETVYWLERLSALDIPIPRVLGRGRHEGFSYLILTYFEGADLGEAYPMLASAEKRQIAVELVAIQKKVALLPIETDSGFSWVQTLHALLDRARTRILQNGYFDVEKVDRLRDELQKSEAYFAAIKPTPYLNDISTKNLLICHGKISGIVDIDEMGLGDPLDYVALTYMALLNYGYDTDYVEFVLDEMKLRAEEKRAFLFYVLLYCVDFMGERGMCFMDKQIEVSPQVIDRLNDIYDRLWNEWNR